VTKKLFKVYIILIYIIYSYFIIWQIFSNQANVYEEENEYSAFVFPKFENIVHGFVSPIVLLLFAVLLFSHIYLGQRKTAIFSSFFAASVLTINDPSVSLIAAALVLFGLAIAFFELKKNGSS